MLQGHPGDVRSHRSAPALHGEALPGLEVLTPLVLHGQSVERGQVHPAALADAELQLLEQRGQEQEHLYPGNVLPNAPPLAQAEQQHLLAVLFVHLGAVSAEETLGPEGFWVLPKLPGRENIGCWDSFSWSWVSGEHWEVGAVRNNIPGGLSPQEGTCLSPQEGLCLTSYSLVMVHLPLVDEHAAILRDVEAVQRCVPGRAGDRKDGELGKPKGSSASPRDCPEGCDPKGCFCGGSCVLHECHDASRPPCHLCQPNTCVGWPRARRRNA